MLAQRLLLYGSCQWVQIIVLNLNFQLTFKRLINSLWIKHEKESKNIGRERFFILRLGVQVRPTRKVDGDSWYFWLFSRVCRSLWMKSVWKSRKFVTKSSCLVTGHLHYQTVDNAGKVQFTQVKQLNFLLWICFHSLRSFSLGKTLLWRGAFVEILCSTHF